MTKDINKQFSNTFLDDCRVLKQKYFLKTRSPLSEHKLLRESDEMSYHLNDNSFQAVLLQSQNPMPVIVADSYGIEINSILLILNNKNDNFDAYVAMKFKNQSKEKYQRYYKIDKEASLNSNNIMHGQQIKEDEEISMIFNKFEEVESER